jgi:hypothetical protein
MESAAARARQKQPVSGNLHAANVDKTLDFKTLDFKPSSSLSAAASLALAIL